MAKQLFIGLDVGTDSVGWAATDENFQLRRLKGKTAWGARLFSEASDAKGRRQFRTSGRRLARRRERINILNTLFDPLIKEKDPTFFLRLDNSMLQNDDPIKPAEAIAECPLFINKKDEKEYYKKYPTIWHLRKALIEDNDDAYSDTRLIYLAIHHIIKYRGNFLTEGEKYTKSFDNSILDKFNQVLIDLFETQDEDEIEENCFVGLAKDKYESFIDIAKNKSKGKSEKKKGLFALMVKDDDSKAFLEMFCTLVAGGEYSSKKLNRKDEETYGDVKIAFNSNYDDNIGTYQDALGDAFDLVDIAKAIYDYCDLCSILNNHNYLADAFVEIYESHKQQLKALKHICKSIDASNGFANESSLYVQIFNQKDNAKNYAAFTHNGSSIGRCNIDIFNKYILGLISPYANELVGEDAKNWAQLEILAETDSLLQTIALRSTSVIPMQLHKQELEIILDNCIRRNIKGIDDNFKTKVMALFKFKIPYYCGPLTTRSEYSNVVFKNDECRKLMPWDYEDAIDFDATKKKFMEGLTNKCTYLKDKNVLPKQSILYQDFDTWNKLNNIRINGNKPTKDELHEIFDFASRRSKTTVNDIKKYFKNIKNVKANDIVISGINANDYLNCSSRAILSKCFDLSTSDYTHDFETAENIIYLKTIYTDSNKDGDQAIAQQYSSLTSEQKKIVSSLKCKGWSPLSREFLELRYADELGEIKQSIIELLRNCEGNLMEVFHKYKFQERVDEYNNKIFGTKSNKQIVSELIEEMPPKMKRPVIQAVRIINEVVKVAKQDPDKIAIEVTREDNDKKTKKKLTDKATARQTQIRSFLSNISKLSEEKIRAGEISLELDSLNDLKKLNGKHLYLYFLQNGRDAYTGEPIDIKDVVDGTKYDTDHIIPQSLMKDDSIDNLVLVKREINQHRSNEYPIPSAIRNNVEVRKLWDRLKKAGMMSEKKYNNLVRGTPLSDDELSAFIAAQINVVNHSNVVIRDVLKRLYPNTQLIFSKAQYPSQIRQELSIPKLRDLNDTHHAVDAYLNIVAGVSLTNKFGDMKLIKAREKNDNISFNLTRYISSILLSKESDQKTNLGNLIDQTSRRHDFLLTYRFDYQDDSFYKQTIYSKESESLIRLHDNLETKRYGGYSNTTTEVNCIATIIGKKKTRYLVGVPHMLIEKAKNGKNIQNELLQLVPHKENENVLVNLKDTLPLHASLKVNSINYICIGKNAKQVNMKPISPIFLSRESERYLYQLIKFVEKNPSISAQETKYIFETDKNGFNKIDFSINKYKKLIDELNALSKNERYNYCPMVYEVNSKLYDPEIINSLTLSEQLNDIKVRIGVFTRRSAVLSDKTFLKSRGAILQDGAILVSNSITGLYHTERKL